MWNKRLEMIEKCDKKYLNKSFQTLKSDTRFYLYNIDSSFPLNAINPGKMHGNLRTLKIR